MRSLLVLLLMVSDNLLIPPYQPNLPKGAERYEVATRTQRIAVTDGRPTIGQVPIASLESKWHVSGGLDGITGWKSVKWKYAPYPEKEWIGPIAVLNSFGNYQNDLGLLRSYAVGTEFHDVLYNAKSGKVFEHRLRVKGKDGWESTLEYRNKSEFPKGYAGLKVACDSCHNQAGTGGYATGLVPGGDTVLSDPLDWSLTKGY